MTRRPRLLDLFCNAGGAARGYQRAGFDVYGVDLYSQPRYPGAFVKTDALVLMSALLSGERVTFHHPDGRAEALGLTDFDAAHASPPCQGYSELRHAPGTRGAPRLIRPTVQLLNASGLPWVLENVEGAAEEMPGAVTLCGSMFGLGVAGRAWLKRHRLFLSNVPIMEPRPCAHRDDLPVVGVYGGHARVRSARHGGRKTRDVWPHGHKAAMAEAMGMDWATTAEMSEAIPPAYAEWLGVLLMAAVAQRRLAA